MKKIYFLLFAAAVSLATVSCEKWLDVNPADEVTEEDLFKVGTGYRNALNGVYKAISSSALYGRELTWGIADVLGQCYDSYEFSRDHVYKEFASYIYTNEKAKSVISSLWSNAYTAIANCNNIIGQIESEPETKFRGGKLEKEMIQGEALALRGFLHFVVLAYFAPAPIMDNTKNWIPYYEKFPSSGEDYLTTDAVIERIIRDLKRGYELVEPFDSYVSENNREDHTVWLQSANRFTIKLGDSFMPDDLFYAFRGYRMNMAAIGAILARVYSYSGQNDLAVQEAQKIIALESDNTTLFEFTSAGDATGDYKMRDDLIMAFSDLNLIKNYEAMLSDSFQFVMSYDYDDLYDSESDYRKTILLDKSGWYYKPKRYTIPVSLSESSTLDILPVIRLSEMYYIMAENYAQRGDYPNATAMLEKVRKARGCAANQLAGVITDHDSFVDELLKEVRREFTEEGLTFFYHKKHNVKFKRSMKDEAFYFPLPENETIN